MSRFPQYDYDFVSMTNYAGLTDEQTARDFTVSPDGQRLREDLNLALRLASQRLDGLTEAGLGPIAHVIREAIQDVQLVADVATDRVVNYDRLLTCYKTAHEDAVDANGRVEQLQAQLNTTAAMKDQIEELIMMGRRAVACNSLMFDALKAEVRAKRIPRGVIKRVSDFVDAEMERRENPEDDE